MPTQLCSAETAMEQAGWTAKYWMDVAQSEIDKMFGEGTALANPTLVAAFMNAAALDYQGWSALAAAESVAGKVADAIGSIGLDISSAAVTIALAIRPEFEP